MAKKQFYNRFIIENNIKQINNVDAQRKCWVYSFLIILFALAIGTFPTFIGYNFSNGFAIGMFVWVLCLSLGLIYIFIRFFIYNYKYYIFRKREYLFYLFLPLILLSVVFCVVPLFTTTFTAYENGSFKIDINPLFYLTIFVPLFFGYIVFLYYAFMKCFGKYTKSGRLKKK